MDKCEREILTLLRKLARFCNDGEAIEVTISDRAVKVRSLDIRGKVAEFAISPECRTLLINVMKSSPRIEL